jgi:hypothetical protein
MNIKEKIKRLSVSNVLNVVEITANLALIFTIIFTFNNFKTEIYNENQNFAISLYKDYSVLVLDKENRQFLDTTYTNHLDKISEDYKYYVGFVLFYAESIYNLIEEEDFERLSAIQTLINEALDENNQDV